MGAVARDVKKLFAGLLWWKARDAPDLKADFEAMEKVDEVSLRG